MAFNRRNIFITTLLVVCLPFLVQSQVLTKHFSITWRGIQEVDLAEGLPIRTLTFDGAIHNWDYQYTPLFHYTHSLPQGVTGCVASISKPVFTAVSKAEEASLSLSIDLKDTIQLKQFVGTARGIASIDLQMIPLIRINNGICQKLISFELELRYITEGEHPDMKHNAYADHSVLSAGKWFKVRVNKTGICKVTYNDLQSMGVDMASVSPENIRVFGKPGGMLPEKNSSFRYDDLPENAIQIVTANAGIFANGDYFLFYATSPDEVFYDNARKFEHKLNYYSNYTYYFLNFDGGPGKRIDVEQQSDAVPNYFSNTFIDFAFYEKNIFNLIKSGKQWVGERLDYNNPIFTIPPISFANVDTSKQAVIKYRFVARATTTSNFLITANENSIASRNVMPYSSENFTHEAVENKYFKPVEGQQQISIRYNPPTTSALGYIDWIELNVYRKMKFTGGQMAFADPLSIAPGKITRFKLMDADANVTIWEVSDPTRVKKINTQLSFDSLVFTLATDSMRRFVAWDNTEFNSVEFDGIVENQDLHGIQDAEMLIVTHPDFLPDANRLADHHRIVEGMTVAVVTNQQVYNEFSSGSPDVSATRDLARMLYQRPSEESRLKFLLLFGDGSYDYKDILANNTNFVLAFETFESQNLVYSTATDDFFGLLDLNEGEDAFGKLDIGIGRFPADNVEQAQSLVDKCIFYSTKTPENLGEWRNSLCFIADDEDSNTHIRQVEDQVTPAIEKNFKQYNISKIYLDAYTQIATPSGARYPEVNKRINEEVKKGVLIMNYTGHGGETGWATESILTLNDINSWTNYSHMPVFMTATCEFSRFDDPGRVSAGEQVFLNPGGGGVALFTTTRLANAGNNVELTIDLYDTIFSLKDGNIPCFGNIIAHAKNQNSSTGLIRNFMLLGDPAMHLAYPRYNVLTTEINGVDVQHESDTIEAMSKVNVEGIIVDSDSLLVDSFHGKVEVKVFDKFRWMMTRGNDPTSLKRYFEVQENVLYQGTATVSDGKFAFSFIVPRDIDFNYGIGKISYYAHNEATDASGYCDSLVIGGSSSGSIADDEGPVIELYMNDERFVSGGFTGENPMLLAYLSDSSGLNMVGNGIGHDLVATIDGNSANSVVLNEYYQADLDSYRTGKVMYNYSGLSDGLHTLRLKAWDVFNNSSEASIDFVVKKDLALQITHVSAYPNPFSQKITIEFEHNLFNAALETTLEVYTLSGSLVRTLGPVKSNSQRFQGEKLEWDGRNNWGGLVNEGIYLLRVLASDGNSSSYKTVRAVHINSM